MVLFAGCKTGAPPPNLPPIWEVPKRAAAPQPSGKYVAPAAQQTVNVGTSANDGTGDPLRTAFQKVNGNFTELYANKVENSGGLATNATINGLKVTGSLTNTALTASRAVVTDANKILASSSATSTEVGYLSGATNNIQPQINIEATVRTARAQAGSLFFDGATSGTRVYSTLTGYSIGTNDFSVRIVLKVPTIENPNGQGLLVLSGANTAQDANGFGVRIAIGGDLAVALTGATGADRIQKRWSAWRSTYAGQVVSLVITRSGTNLVVYQNGSLLSGQIEETSGSPPSDWAQTVTSTYMIVGGGAISSSSMLSQARVFAASLFNYALPGTGENSPASMDQFGIPAVDQWGLPAASYSSDFVAGADGWTSGAGLSSATGNIDAIGGQDDNLRLTSDGTTGTHRAVKTAQFSAGRRYLVKFSYYLPSTNTTALKFGLGESGVSGGFASPAAATTDAWTSYQESAISVSGGQLDILLANASGATSFTGTSGDVFYLRGLSVARLGAVVDLDCAVGKGFYVPDRSPNLFWGQAVGGVSHWEEKQRGEIVVSKAFLHSDISSTAATTSLLTLPKNCGILDVEFDRETAFDASTTLDVGITGTQTKFVSAANVAATGKLLVDSGSKVSESSSADTTIWIKKNQATTQGKTTVRVRYVIRGL